MIVKRVDPTRRTSRTGELFIGAHDYQPIIGTESAQFRVSELTFRDGARTKAHTHDSEQIVIVTAGEGIVATADEQRSISVGDIALIPAGESHWHGAPVGGSVSQLSLLGPHTTRLA